MRFPAVILATVLAISAAFVGPASARTNPFGVHGDDDRKLVEKSDYPWHSIGRINNSGRSFCTGTLIGNREVLTAAHCLRSRVPGRAWAPASAIHFLAGYTRGEYVAHARAVSFSLARGRPGREDLDTDFAIVSLARPIGKSLGYVPIEAFDLSSWKADRKAGMRYIQAGYSHDHSHILTRHTGCEITKFRPNGRTFSHTCDATHGDSGSPILVKRKQGFAMVGVHVASSRGAKRGLAIAGRTVKEQLSAILRSLPLAYKR